MDYIEVSAKNKDEAIIKASMELETPSDELDIQVISEGSSGFLGFGGKPAIIRARKKDASELEAEKQVQEIKASVETQQQEEIKIAEATEVKPEVKEEPKQESKEEISKEEETTKVETSEEAPVQRTSSAREGRPVELITDAAEIEELKKTATEFLSSVFQTMGIEVTIQAEYNTEDRCLDVDFSGDDMGILIGKRGQTLDSLQYLTSLVINKGKSGYVRVKLDTEDYRRRRKETLENLAKGIAYKVRKTRKPVTLEPMNPYERRIIHSALQGNRNVETFSEGEEPYRHIVVKLKSYK